MKNDGRVPTARQLAREVLERVELEGAYANRALLAALDRAPAMAADERGLATEIVYGVLRRHGRLERALAALATSGLDRLEPRVRIAMRMGAYQILFLDRIPAYAAVNDAVEACKQAGGRGVGGLRERVAAPAGARRRAAAARRRRRSGRLSDGDRHARLARADAAGRAAAGRRGGVRRRRRQACAGDVAREHGRMTRDELAVRLAAERPDATLAPSQIAPDALDARSLAAPAATAAWRDGLFAIADAGAQVVAELCGAAPGERIMDACAGNGGKTAHLLSLAGDRARVDAVDVSADKLDMAAAALRRLGLAGASPVVADLTAPLADQTPRYHRILLDAPCSGLGVLRRHPETLLRRQPADIDALAERQLRMLSIVAPALLPGGLLTYAVCTFERRECEDVVAAFLRAHPRFAIEPAPTAGGGVPWARLADATGAIRTWPQRDDADGFFAVRLRLAGRVAEAAAPLPNPLPASRGEGTGFRFSSLSRPRERAGERASRLRRGTRRASEQAAWLAGLLRLAQRDLQQAQRLLDLAGGLAGEVARHLLAGREAAGGALDGARRPVLLELQQRRQVHGQRVRQARDHLQGGVAGAALDLADQLAADVGALAQLFLREPPQAPERAQAAAEQQADIRSAAASGHAGMVATGAPRHKPSKIPQKTVD